MDKRRDPILSIQELKKIGVVGAISFCIIAVAIGLTPWVIAAWSSDWSEPTARGAFGDQFGITNAVFSGLAFVAVAVTLALQTIEFREQRKLSERQQDSVEAQAKTQEAYLLELQAQSKSAKEQADSLFFTSFETYFLTNIQILIAERDRITVGHGIGERYQGPTAFHMAIKYLRSDYDSYIKSMPRQRRELLGDEGAEREAVIESYKRMYFAGHTNAQKYISQFGFFFALFGTCCDRVATLTIRPDARQKYVDVLRSICIGDFGAMIFYHAVAVDSRLLKRICDLQLMVNVPPTSLYRGSKDCNLQPAVAFDT